ncbi:Tad domain-containing protein [Allosphingosinicella flava]|uniref:Tad domain-containing protein n=2 Tax=Allosphingosinicella flava TaxID=2771430 RepID=A0A7T2GL57_9SPHN|nr:Tad domain-containing protein [Sphingosinicella flava]
MDRRGNALVLIGAAMPVIVGSAGLAVDTIQLSLLKRQMQRAADSGALAGAFARVQNKTIGAAVQQALDYNGSVRLAAPPVIENAPTTGPYANNNRAVRVILTAKRSVPFMSFFTGHDHPLRVEATAALVYTGKYCMVALDESVGTGITFSGNSTVNLGCGVIANNSGAAAVSGAGSAAVVASPIAAVGGVPPSSAYKGETLLLPYSLKQADPFANLPHPSPPSPCSGGAIDVGSKATQNIGPGCYTGLAVHGTLNLAPGTYYITGDITINAQSTVKGTGVTLVFTSPTPTIQTSFPNIRIDGGAKLDLTAPSSGDYKGVLMYYDGRRIDGDHYINGNSYSKLEGAFYFPKQRLTFNGNSGMDSNCIQLVANRLTFTGNTEITNSCPSDGGAKSFDASWVRLVR